MKINTKNQAQLIAELIHFGQELEPITNKEFWTVYEEHNAGDEKCELNHYEHKDFRCEYTYFYIDGYEYYSYGYLVNSGYDGFDSVGYICRKKVSTNAEINAFIEMMSK
jgi:hypothetical protein